jgi:hypothetical protein
VEDPVRAGVINTVFETRSHADGLVHRPRNFGGIGKDLLQTRIWLKRLSLFDTERLQQRHEEGGILVVGPHIVDDLGDTLPVFESLGAIEFQSLPAIRRTLVFAGCPASPADRCG